MAETKIYKNVRFANRIDTEFNWIATNPTLEPGELAFVGENGDYYMILGDTHKKPIRQIISEIPSGLHDTHVFYPGKSTSSGGGGAGGSTSIPVASATILGGVKVPEEKVSGLTISGDGTLKNSLISKYDYDRNCFVVNKLYIKDLEYDDKVANPSFEGDFLTLRADSTNALDVKAGIVIKSLQEGFDGFLGLSAENKIIVAQTDGTYAEMVGISPTGTPLGLVSYTTGNNYATITPCSNLTFTTNSGTTIYNPATAAASINVSSPPISVNGQVFNYNATADQYEIELDGGLSSENLERLEQIEMSLDDIENLKVETITEVYSGNNITVVNNNDRTVTVNHNVKSLLDSGLDTKRITVGPLSDNPEKINILADIEVDEYGHITKKKFFQISWVTK